MLNATPLDSFIYKGIEVLVKREDANPTGSHKDRGIWPLIEYYSANRKQTTVNNKFVISSSGNAAVSAAYYCIRHGLGLDIFVKEDIPPWKLEKIKNIIHSFRHPEVHSGSRQKNQKQKDSFGFLFSGSQIESGMTGERRVVLHQSSTPRRDTFQFAKQSGAILISTSTDDLCLAGYSEIVKELPKDIEAIFIPASSGALALGMYEGYTKSQKHKITKTMKQSNNRTMAPKFFIVQTPRVHPLVAQDVDESELSSKSSMADAISDVIGARKDEIHKLIKNTGGAGVVAEDRFINNAMKLLVKHLRITNPSPNGALAFAGFLKVLAKGEFPYKKVVCLYTGE